MRRRAGLAAALALSLAAHAAVVACLSSVPPGRDHRRPRTIDVELLAPAPTTRSPIDPGLAASPPGRAAASAATTPKQASRGGAAPARSRPAPEDRAERSALPGPVLGPGPAPADPAWPETGAHPAAASAASVLGPEAHPSLEGERAQASGVADAASSSAKGEAESGASAGDGAQPGNAAFRSPRLAERNCVRDAIRLPASLRGFASPTISVKFAVAPDGTASELQVVGVPDERVAGAVRQAVQACRWTPGTDGSGRPVTMWVVMPIRFERG